ncbi:TPA: DUF1317 family protein [Escherichia coli]|uniref:DUF1317 family protein n=1 Tax=Enterobacteriaceae TaxID=543 RepID=UPI00164156AB|nr:MULTISPECIES: DUF1317 family protein [Enterobacteriaceae]EJZ9501547.1 DUF1317 family protein [Escherichia coli]MCO4884198.1 DUF1317 domain-containing protein [Escherichia coli]HAW0524844.1 DUF1317 family protein [Escherichia coli]HCN8394632.1 DUF1317 family protein [Escherichia coli]HDW3617440.1 DUF1317 family protein [Escherichia coli]
MTNAKDNIRVGRIIMVYSEQKHGWIAPGGRVIRNPLKAQRLAEELNGKKVAA